jgi:hypothetical protein
VAKKRITNKTENMKKHTTKKTRTKVAGAESTDRPQQQVIARNAEVVHGVYQDVFQSEQGFQALKRAGFTETHASLLPVAPGTSTPVPNGRTYTADMRTDLSDTGTAIARLAGSALAISSMAIAAPIVLALPVLALGVSAITGGGAAVRRLQNTPRRPILITVKADGADATNDAAKILQSTGAEDISLSRWDDAAGDDLKTREYRDETGQVHHHTRTYLRDHGPKK